jgi:hypothetical protein
MCFSFEASIISFFIGTFFSIWIFLLGRPFDKVIGAYWLYVCLMQGIEAILWKHQTCDDLHKTVSFLGHGLNVSQPVILAGLLILYSKYARPIPLVIISILYILYGLIYLLRSHTDAYYCTAPRKNDPHLLWNWTVDSGYLIYDWLAYIVAISGIAYFGMTGLQAFLFIGSFSTLLFWSYVFYPRQSIASIWCFFAALSPPIYLIFRKLGYVL